jgi:predicted amidohydrolase
MKVAAFQAPYLPFGSLDGIDMIKEQLAVCEAQSVEVLCCPEAIIGGLAIESDGQSPAEVAIGVDDGELVEVLGPLMDTPVTVIIGFTERDDAGDLFSSAAVIADGRLASVYRKVFPGYRTAIKAGTQLPVFALDSARFGIMICNDIWYVEPARILAAAGAAVLFVPSNSGYLRNQAAAAKLRARGENLPVARAVDNTATVVVADIAGAQNGRFALGSTRIIDPDGTVLAGADSDQTELLVADVEAQRRPHGPRGWDGHTNPAVAEAFLRLWSPA